MTKREELKLLEKINEMIESAGKDSYICMTFAGMVDVCRDNIEYDFGSIPVRDLSDERMRTDGLRKDIRGMEITAAENAETIKRLNARITELKDRVDVAEGKAAMEGDRAESAIKLLEEERAANRALREQVAELTDARDTLTDCVNGNIGIFDKLETEVMRLKAEIYDLRKECGK